MKLSFALFVALLPLAATAQNAKAATPSKPKVAAAPAAVQIPKGAVETEPGTFRFTDTQGKKWIYNKTPFGIARREDKGEAAAAVAAPAPTEKEQKVRATDKGDVVAFERPGPFGVYRWERKKSELSEQERGWLNENTASARTTSK